MMIFLGRILPTIINNPFCNNSSPYSTSNLLPHSALLSPEMLVFLPEDIRNAQDSARAAWMNTPLALFSDALHEVGFGDGSRLPIPVSDSVGFGPLSQRAFLCHVLTSQLWR